MEILEELVFKEQMREKAAKTEEILRHALPEKGSCQETLHQAVEYSLMGGGKRLRPMLLQESYHLFGGEEDDVVATFMAAIEMIHTYSLVHDDLPAMDNDDYRRGRETTHKVFGEGMAILVGDALLNYAYETAIGGVRKAADTKHAAEAFAILAAKAGIFGMVGGQAADIGQDGKMPGQGQTSLQEIQAAKEQVDFIYRLKTGALLEAALMSGAALAGADWDMIDKMEEIGRNVGMAFQIQDDILDITSTTQELGKPVHSDEKNEKITYASLYGLGQAKHAVEDYSQKALGALGRLPKQSIFLNTLIQMLVHRKK